MVSRRAGEPRHRGGGRRAIGRLAAFLFLAFTTLPGCSAPFPFRVDGLPIEDALARLESESVPVSSERFLIHASGAVSPLHEDLQRALVTVEAALGPIDEQPIRVFVFEEIVRLGDGGAQRPFRGLAHRYRGRPVLLVTRPGPDSVLIHELVHLRMWELGERLPRPLEEGLAYALELGGEAPLRDDLARHVRQGRAVDDWDLLLGGMPAFETELEVRLTAWAVVTTLIRRDGLRAAEVARMTGEEVRERVEIDEAVRFISGGGIR